MGENWKTNERKMKNNYYTEKTREVNIIYVLMKVTASYVGDSEDDDDVDDDSNF